MSLNTILDNPLGIAYSFGLWMLVALVEVYMVEVAFLGPQPCSVATEALALCRYALTFVGMTPRPQPSKVARRAEEDRSAGGA